MLESCLHSDTPFKMEPLISLIQEKAKVPDLLAEIKASNTIKIPAISTIQIKCKVKVCSNNFEQTVYFEPRINENEDELNISETVSKLRTGRTQYIFIDLSNMG